MLNKNDVIRHFEMTWTAFRDYVKKEPFALLPVGALEQHGPHLPMGTDVVIAECLAEEVAKRTGFILMPALVYTPSFSLRKYPGTVRLSDESFVLQLLDIAQSLEAHGIMFVYLIICHIGAINACKSAERKLILSGSKLRLVNIAVPGMQEAIHKYCESKRWHPTYAHAEEFETSLMLAIQPNLVHMEKAASEYPQYNPLFGPISIGWENFCKSGVIGDPTVATAKKGKDILKLMVDKGVQIIKHHQAELGNL
jgi:creatinine amidohydrolase